MSDLRISPELALPLDWMTMATVVYGARGAGKTNLGVVVAEELWQHGQRFCAVDLKGDWWGLKAPAQPGHPAVPAVIFGGEHADLPLDDGSGAATGELVAQTDQPFIVDLERMSKGRQVRWLREFFQALYDHNREPLLVIADEVQRYAPQRPMSPDETLCLAATEDLVKLGRKHGLGVLALTQRGAGLNKEVSELCDVLVALRTPGPLDQDRIKDWLDANATREQRETVMALLAKLPTGTAVFASGHPELNLFQVVPIRHRSTYDSSATPRVGQRRVAPQALTPVDIAALQARLAGVIATTAANDPRTLQARIAELERQLRHSDHRGSNVERAAPIVEVRVERVPVLSASDTMLLGNLHGRLQSIDERWRQDLAEAQTQIAEVRERIQDLLTAVAVREATADGAGASARPQTMAVANRGVDSPLAVASDNQSHADPRQQAQSKPASQSLQDLALSQKRILGALMRLTDLGLDAVPKPTLGALSGYSSGGGYFRNMLSNMSARNLVRYQGDDVTITEDGRSAARLLGVELDAVTSLDDLHQAWYSLLDGGQRKLLEPLIRAYPEALTLDRLGVTSGLNPAGGYFRNLLGSLRTLKLVTPFKRGDTTVAATPLLFPALASGGHSHVDVESGRRVSP